MNTKIYPPVMGIQINYSVFVRIYFVNCSRTQAKYLLTNTVVAHGGDTTKDLYTATISQEPALLHYYNNTRPQLCFPTSRQPTLFSRLYGLYITRVTPKTLHNTLSQATSLLPPPSCFFPIYRQISSQVSFLAFLDIQFCFLAKNIPNTTVWIVGWMVRMVCQCKELSNSVG